MLRRIIMSLILGVVLPSMLFSGYPTKEPETSPPAQIQSAQTPQISVEVVSKGEEEPIYIPVLQKDGTVVQMELEYYVWGVVLGEMPASFEPEALKAQAVAARTYAIRGLIEEGHDGAAVCQGHACCQNYCDPLTYGGGDAYRKKVHLAVQQTKGLVATYEGKPIFAAYFASSGGKTEDAVEVWGNAVPYLRSVSSPGEPDKAYQNTSVTFTAAQFQQKLGGKLEGKPGEWFGKVTYTKGGGVNTIRIGGQVYSGVKLRNLLGLRSTVFSVKVSGDRITFTTNGYGHRVGMSQYGAQAMALEGYDYASILQHYYGGIGIEKYPLHRD